MLKNLFLLILLLAAILMCGVGCKQSKEEPPVAEAKMTRILLDLHLAETYSQGLGDSMKNKFEKNYDTLPSFYKSVLNHHQISFEEFNEAIQWYKNRPVEIDSLYVKVLNQLNELKAQKGIKDITEPEKETAKPAQDTATVKKTATGKEKDSVDNRKKDTTISKKTTRSKQPTVKVEP